MESARWSIGDRALIHLFIMCVIDHHCFHFFWQSISNQPRFSRAHHISNERRTYVINEMSRKNVSNHWSLLTQPYARALTIGHKCHVGVIEIIVRAS